MIKVEFTKIETGPHAYPAMYESTRVAARALVVLFTDATHGTVMLSTHTDRVVGEYSATWVECTRTDAWRRLSPGETVTLSNA
jgi:hypothetical protein